ncbi:MAG: 5-formyltetrahydrofolate cyclo-ligase [Bdellovibrionia bacterium]
MLAKSEVRAKFRRLRDEFVGAARPGELEQALATQLAKVLTAAGPSTLPNSQTWVGYQRTSTEADPSVGIKKSNRNWAYPKVDGDDLRFFVPRDERAWVKSSWGILEPDPSQSDEIQIEDASGVLVPGLVFDRNGTRIGSGKGFYDRALKNYQGVKVGVALSVQVSDKPLPSEPFDVAMDVVVTEKTVIAVTKGQPYE